jgi:excisionase family DNA binding protein
MINIDRSNPADNPRRLADGPRLMTRKEVADFLKVSVRSVDRLRRSGALPAVMVLTKVRFRVEDVEALLNATPPTGSTTPRP